MPTTTPKILKAFFYLSEHRFSMHQGLLQTGHSSLIPDIRDLLTASFCSRRYQTTSINVFKSLHRDLLFKKKIRLCIFCTYNLLQRSITLSNFLSLNMFSYLKKKTICQGMNEHLPAITFLAIQAKPFLPKIKN